MKKWLFALTLLVLILPCLAVAMSDEESQRLVAEEEEKAAQFVPKGGPEFISKDVIIEALRQRRIISFDDRHILFHYGLPKIREEFYPQLGEIAAALKQAAQLPDLSQIRTYHVDGHCCRIGTAEFNCKLSWARAYAVIDELVKMGVPPEKLVPVGYGFHYPAHSNETEESRRLNRRVEFYSDAIEVAVKGNRVACNLPEGGRSGSEQWTRPIEPPAPREPEPPRPAVSDQSETGPKGKQPLTERAVPPGFRIESEGTAKSPFPTGSTQQPAREKKGTPLPPGFREVK